MPPFTTPRKIFISYKYADSQVAPLPIAVANREITQGRHYVTVLEEVLKDKDHIYKGERDNESLDGFKNETIESKLRNKIFDSSVTVVLLTKGMKDLYIAESEQWIPWEISYSLKEITKGDKTSGTNAILAVAIPDENGDYSYMVNHYPCVTQWNTASLFEILSSNMFNRNQKNLNRCATCSGIHHTGQDHSYIHPVKWSDFISNVDAYINHVIELNKNLEHFDLVKQIN